MPIPVKVHDNSSLVKVKGGCGTDTKRLEHLIKEETHNREEADENLQLQIDQKQDKFHDIVLTEPTGIIDQESLNLLISNTLSGLKLNDTYYRLSFRDSNYLRYMGSTTDPNTLNTIVVNRLTGEYVYSKIENAVLQNHIADENKHLREGEREFWNNKLNCETHDELLEFTRN